MFDWLSSLPALWGGLAGSLMAGLATGVGALLIFVREHWSQRAQVWMLAVAAGVMLGATVFSLLVPALTLVEQAGGSTLQSALVVGGGLCLGALAVWGLHELTPHAHFERGSQGPARFDLGRNWLFILAITLHNFPEGMSVGVAYGGDGSSGEAVTLGIGLQNIPEGLAVAAALLRDGFTRSRAFAVGLLTGLVEPVGGLFGALAVSVSHAVLPWGLSFAGGAMLFVIAGEVIPETHREGREQTATFSLVLGFVVMMVLDVSLG